MNSESNKNLYKYILICIIKCENTFKPKIIQTADIIFDICLLVGARHYSSFM